MVAILFDSMWHENTGNWDIWRKSINSKVSAFLLLFYFLIFSSSMIVFKFFCECVRVWMQMCEFSWVNLSKKILVFTETLPNDGWQEWTSYTSFWESKVFFFKRKKKNKEKLKPKTLFLLLPVNSNRELFFYLFLHWRFRCLKVLYYCIVIVSQYVVLERRK